MLLRYYGFQKDPFGVTPDPQCIYQSPTHREALASLNYGFYSNRGFTALIAPPGMGKTTLLHHFLNGIQTSARTAFLFDIQCEPIELLNYMLRDLGIVPARNGIEMREQLKGLLVTEAREGRIVVVVIDEAQNLSDAQLEMLRLLTNFETRQAKLMQIVLAGQPALADTLIKPSLEQLRQRVSTICRLTPLTPAETKSYIDFRMKEAGYVGTPLFTEEALGLIADASRGIPRSINNVCFNALSLCCALKANKVTHGMVDEVIVDLELSGRTAKSMVTPIDIAATQKKNPEERETSTGRRHFWRRTTGVVVAASALFTAVVKLGPSMPGEFANLNTLSTKLMPSIHRAQAAEVKQTPVSKESILPAAPLEILVGPGQRIHDIAMKYFGKCDNQLLYQIQRLNPELTDPDHVEAGMKIRLPGLQPVPSEGRELPFLDARVLGPFRSVPKIADLVTSVAGNPTPKVASFDVIVEPNETLTGIANRYLGSFNSQCLRQIQALNPKLTNPSHILRGQKIRLPGRPPRTIVETSSPNAAARSTP